MKRIFLIIILFFTTFLISCKEVHEETASYYIYYTNDIFPNYKIDILCETNFKVITNLDNLYEPITSNTHKTMDKIIDKTYNDTLDINVYFDSLVNRKIILRNEFIKEKDYKLTLHHLIIRKYYAVDTLTW